MRMLYYFPHPSNLRLQREVITMRRKEGPAGYGIFIMLLELIRDSEGLQVYDDPESLSFAINENDVSLISRICHDYSLFRSTDNGNLESPFLLMCQEQADARKAQAREWGKKGAKARYSHADQQQPSPFPDQDPPEPGPQPTPEHSEHAYRVPIPPPIGTPCLETNKQTNGENKIKTNQPTKSKLPEMEWLGISGIDWLEMCNSSDLMGDEEAMRILELPSYNDRNPRILAEWIRKYGLPKKIWGILQTKSDNWRIDTPVFQAIFQVIKQVRDTKYKPQHPAHYLISTAIKFYRDDT